MEIQPLRKYPLPHNILVLIALTLCYIILGALGHYIAEPETNASPIWPASGFALAVVLLLGYRAAIAVFLGCWIESGFRLMEYTQISSSDVFMISLIMGVGCSLQAIVGAFLIQFFELSHDFLQRPSTVVKLLFFGTLSCLISATIGVTTMALEGLIPWTDYLKIWFTWLLGDTGGVFLVTPLLLAWFGHYKPRRYFGRTMEIMGLCLFLIAVSLINLKGAEKFFYLFFPGLLWAALHFGFRGATLALLYMMIYITYATVNGFGDFVRPSMEESLVFLEMFIIVLTGTILLHTAELEQREYIHKKWEGSSHTHRYVNRIKTFFGFHSKD